MDKQKPDETADAGHSDDWYAEGLRFRCTGCGDCCTGAPGFVWVNQAEIDALARRLEITPAEFEEQYVRLIGIRRSLVEEDNYDCVFFDSKTRRCQVYEDRPRQCRTWPFWKSNLKSASAWEETAQSCPGCNRGRLYDLEQINKQATVIHV